MVRIDQTQCVGCSLCADDCVAQNIQMANGKAKILGSCMLCGHCVAICPSRAATIPEYPMEEIVEYDKKTCSIAPESFLNAVKCRRSIRQFEDRPIEPDQLKRILDAGRYTETAVNYQDVRFIVVQERLAEAKALIWEGWRRYALSLQEKNIPHADKFMDYYHTYKQNPLQDRLFFAAPVLCVVAADIPLDGGLASANLEMMAVAEGLGVMFDGYIAYAIGHSPEAREWLGLGQKQLSSCLLLGHPKVTYRRSAPRRAADIVWR